MDFYKIICSLIKLNIRNSIFRKLVLVGARIFFYLKFILATRFFEFINRFKYGKLDLNNIYIISPQRFQFYLRNKIYFKWNNSMRILDGNWDFTKKPLEELVTYRMIMDVFKERKRWDETELYNLLPDRLKNEEKTWTFKNKEIRDKLFFRTEQLYKDIKRYGYKSQQDLYSFKSRLITEGCKPVIDEIAAAIDRDGQFLLINGKHRLFISKVLQIQDVPIVVLIRHKKWLDFRNELREFSKKSSQRKINFCFNHPDLQDIPSSYNDSCFQIINQHKSATQGTFLDISPRLGIFCHKFEEIGFNCYAIEENGSSDYFLKKIKKVEGKNFKIISKDILLNSLNETFIFTICLYTF